MHKIQKYLQEFTNERSAATRSFYLWKSLDDFASEERKYLNVLQRNAESWVVIRYSLFVNFFMAFGKVFDTDGKAITVHKLLRACIDNVDFFSKEQLRARAMEGKVREPNYLKDWLNGRDEPTARDLQRIQREKSKRHKIYEDKYRPIRNQIIAHRTEMEDKDREELYEKTDIGEIEEILVFLHQTERVIWELSVNGRLYDLGDVPRARIDYVSSDLKQLLDSLVTARKP